METIEGTFHHVIFTSEDTGFTVAKLTLDTEDLVTIVGHLADIRPGESIECKGRWKSHPNHGDQFEVDSYVANPPHTIDGIRRYLESSMVQGIGKKYARRIVDSFGHDTLRVIEQAPHRLLEVEGIGKKRVAKIKQSWRDQQQMREVMLFLKSHGVGTALANKIYKKYGDEATSKIKNEPYTVASQLHGVGFKTMDNIAKSMGVSMDSPGRVQSGIEYTLSQLSDDGHVALPQSVLTTEAAKILEVDEDAILSSIETLVQDQKIVRKTFEESDQPIIWLRLHYACESGIAKEIERLKEVPSALRSVDTERALTWIEKEQKIQFADLQKVAISTSLCEKLHIITGGPGTGKSTITKAILGITEKISDKILLAAPTGRAAKRLSEITKQKAFTIHALLEFDFTNGSFKRNADNPLGCELLIIDEASMIDTFLMFCLLKAIPADARIILIGDIDQLPSVGAGNVLKDLIDSEQIVTTKLTKIYRQQQISRIVINAHRINQGIFPDVTPNKDSDFHFLSCEAPAEILETIVGLNANRLPGKYNFDPLEDIQVLSPMKKGMIGTENLNVKLQEALNPKGETLEVFGRSFREGDKVMQIRNNYQKGVYNGDVGILIDIDKEEDCVIIKYDGREVEYDFAELDEVVLAYAVSIHKYQGSESKCIIMPIHSSHYKLLYRNLLYTGLTRGKSLVVIVGSRKAIHMAVSNDHVKKRHTYLKHLLTANSNLLQPTP